MKFPLLWSTRQRSLRELTANVDRDSFGKVNEMLKLCSKYHSRSNEWPAVVALADNEQRGQGRRQILLRYEFHFSFQTFSIGVCSVETCRILNWSSFCWFSSFSPVRAHPPGTTIITKRAAISFSRNNSMYLILQGGSTLSARPCPIKSFSITAIDQRTGKICK